MNQAPPVPETGGIPGAVSGLAERPWEGTWSISGWRSATNVARLLLGPNTPQRLIQPRFVWRPPMAASRFRSQSHSLIVLSWR
jgi:hypothetical protein